MLRNGLYKSANRKKKWITKRANVNVDVVETGDFFIIINSNIKKLKNTEKRKIKIEYI